MPKRRIIAYVDGFNFYYRRLRNKPYRWLDLVKLFEQLFPEDDVVAVRYFTARIGGKFDVQKPLRQQTYLRALSTLDKLDIIEGNYLTKKVKYRLVDPIIDASGNKVETVQVWRPEEKGSDVNLGAYLMNDAWDDAFDVAAVITNDSDLAAPMRMVLNRGKTVLLLHPDDNPSRSLIPNSTGVVHIHDNHLLNAQLPASIVLANGKTVRKPDSF
jgi:hypothetical protein